MTDIHPTAIVEDGAVIGEGTRIGPYSIVGPNVELAEGVVLESHAVVAGHTSVGAGTHIFPFASIGHKPQDLKFAGEVTRLEIGYEQSDPRARHNESRNRRRRRRHPGSVTTAFS